MSDREFTIIREFDAPRELVFRAWTDPDQLAKWSAPEGMSAPRASITGDVRPGGAYSSTMVRDETGENFAVSGRYLEVVEPERLVFTWGDPTGDGTPERESVITVTFAERAGKTTMTFHLQAPGPLSPEDGARSGWSQSFGKLADLVRV
ncbi:MAG TPA: SRPBCC domain-containing protein [Aldersonia sp.]